MCNKIVKLLNFDSTNIPSTRYSNSSFLVPMTLTFGVCWPNTIGFCSSYIIYKPSFNILGQWIKELHVLSRQAYFYIWFQRPCPFTRILLHKLCTSLNIHQNLEQIFENLLSVVFRSCINDKRVMFGWWSMKSKGAVHTKVQSTYQVYWLRPVYDMLSARQTIDG